jgi:PAS domain S-box-containing protein
MAQRGPLTRSGRSVLLNYAVAVASVAAALLLGLLLDAYLQTRPYASLLVCAVMFSAWFGGLGPGLLSTACSLLAFVYFFVRPQYTFDIDPAELPRIVLLATAALFAVWLNVARRSAILALRRNQVYLAEAQRLSRTGSFGWNTSDGDITWSDEAYRIFGVDRTVRPTINLVLERVHNEDRERVQREIDAALQGGRAFDYEHRIVMPDGSIKHLQICAHRLRQGSSEEEIIGAMMDVTAKREAQHALQIAQSELARVARVTALGELSASIAHEVNQPLAAIATNASAGLRWLSREVPDLDEARAAVNRIVQDANRASAVIRRVRNLAKRADPEMTRIDINEVVEESIALAAPQATNHQVTIELDLASALPPVLGDRIQIEQVIINLATNGIQAMLPVTDRARVLTIRTELHESDGIIVSVEDSGVGVEPGAMERLFSAFYTTKAEGMGMGLTICSSIIAAHRGRIWACPNAEAGMTFRVALPVYEEEGASQGSL